MNDRLVIRVVDVYPYRLTDGTPRFLLLRRAPGVPYEGAWRMVGGKLRPGEHSVDAARRELDEETRLKPAEMWAIPSPNLYYEWREDRVNVIPAFAARVEGDPHLDDEHDVFGWFSIEEALEVLHFPEQRRLVGLIDEALRRGVPREWMVTPPDDSG